VQKETRAFNWNERGPIVVLVIVGMVLGTILVLSFGSGPKEIWGPALPLQLAPPQLGSPNAGWFRMFAASARSCIPIPSRTVKFLPREKLIVVSPGPTRLFLRSLPKVP